jgi:uncharacterized damage-inducible protein DinB
MSVTVTIDQVLDYSDHERQKWHAWFAVDPARLRIPFQPGGRFPNVGALIDHIVLVERRHLSRLEGATPPESTGLAATDLKGLFEFGDLVRADLRRYVEQLDDARAGELMTMTIAPGTFTMTRRRLALHIVLHEIRHWAQIAFAVRLAGHEPPGNHDLFFFTEFA